MNRLQNARYTTTAGQQGQTQRFGAHEFLETQEALRTKAADIELYGVLINDAQDPHLRDILTNQQRRMVQTFQQCVGLLNSRGVVAQTAMVPHTPQMNVYEQPQIGLNNPTFPAVNPNAKRMSDFAIATTALNLHKAGAVFSMNWTLECVAPEIRAFHATCANTCQEMAYELFQYMNYQGQYQVPQLADHTMNTMIQAVQGMNVGGMGMTGQGMTGQGMTGRQGVTGQGMAGYGMTTQGVAGQGVTGMGVDTADTNYHMNTFTGQAARYTTTGGGDYNARY